MHSVKKIAQWTAACALAALAVPAGCGSDEGATGSDDGGATDDSSGDVPTLGESGACSSAADCDGGVCITATGTCCDEASHVCGGACCAGGTVCFFDQCVTPGKPCHTSNDCDPGEYCEPSLGDNGDGGANDAGDSGCIDAITLQGRCLPLPPTCVGDSGVSADGGPCLQPCEYHPPGGSALTAVKKWAWGPVANAVPDKTDVWSTPTVGRLYDTNCDGKIDELDSPVIVFVSGNVHSTCCSCNGAATSTCHDGVLRMLDGKNGNEIWTLDKASAGSVGFMGFSIATGDVTGDGYMDIVAMTGEGDIVVVDRNGKIEMTSDKRYPGAAYGTGWGGGIAIADMDADGHAEIAYGDTVWTTKTGSLVRSWVGGYGTGGGSGEEISAISDMDQAANGHLELLAGNTCYRDDGSVLWRNTNVPDGFPGVGDFDKDGTPEAVVVASGKVWILKGADGTVALSGTLGGTGSGGPPTVADFDGDGKPEIGVAQANYYSVMKPNYGKGTIDLLWKMQNHDYSSSVTGSTVFDFEGDGIAEVVYADECFLWVFDGPTGKVRLAWSHSSFTATEASMVADIDGDGHAEMLVPSPSVDMGANGWHCAEHAQGAGGGPLNGQYWVPGPMPDKSYRGLVALGDSADSWVGTRTLWTEHTYHVTNVCDDRDTACALPNVYGSIPKSENKNWTLPWLNDFRQNVQDKGIFNAPDPVVALAVDCVDPVVAHVSVRNVGQAGLPSGVDVGVFVTPGDVQVGQVTTTYGLLPGQTQTLDVTLSSPATKTNSFYAKILVDPKNPKFHSCRTDDEQSQPVHANCTQ